MIRYRTLLLLAALLCCSHLVACERNLGKRNRNSNAGMRTQLVRGGDDADEAVKEDESDESSSKPSTDSVAEKTNETQTLEESENVGEKQVVIENDDNDESAYDTETEEDEQSEENSSGENEVGEESLNSNTIEITNDEAIELRLQGKEFHDQGDFVKAAELFQKAADSIHNSGLDSDDATEEYVTCRLHQALCHLKSENYESCIEACTDVLGDEINPTTYSSAVRARAYHRRAKAKLALEDPSGALQDARSAAFLGDRRAVAFYGKLMRENSPFSSDDTSLKSILSSSSSGSLLESWLSKSSNTSPSESEMPDFGPASLLLGNSLGAENMLSALGSGKKGSSLAKSVMESLLKRLEDESTQATISTYLQSTNKQQLQQLTAMAGASHIVQDSHLDKILSVCHGVTPKTIRKTVRTSKRAVYGVKLVRKVTKIIDKYKTILIAIALLQWTKSACVRPMPLNRQAAKRANKKLLNDALKKNRKP